MAKVKRSLLLLILVVGLFLRGWQFNQVPPSLFGDEIDTGYQAYSILKTGRDYFGNFLPVHFQSFGDWRMPLYIYLTVPLVALFGLTEMATRLPSLIFGMMTIFVTYLVIKKISQDEKIALLSAFFLAISPWHVHFSRLALEVGLMNLLLLLGFWLFLKESFFLAAISWGFSLYAYSTAKLFLPLLLGAILLFHWPKMFSRRRLRDFWLPFLLICLPMIYNLVFNQGMARFSTISIFADPSVPKKVEMLRRYCPWQGKLARAAHNKVTVYFSEFLKNYFSSFSTEFLFASGDPNRRHNPLARGEIYWLYLPLIFLGALAWLMNYLKSKKKEILILFAWVLLTPIPAALTQNGGTHAIRLFQFLPWWQFFTATGLVFLVSRIKSSWQKWGLIFAFSLILLVNFFSYYHHYFSHFPRQEGIWWEWWNYGYRELFEFINPIENNYEQVFISPSHGSPIVFALFYHRYPPAEIQREITISSAGFGKFIFANPDLSFLDSGEKREKILFVDTPGSLDASNYQLEDYANIDILEKIIYPDGKVVFYVFQTK